MNMWLNRVVMILYFIQMEAFGTVENAGDEFASFVCVEDFFWAAKEELNGMETRAWDYMMEGSDEQFTAHQNRKVFQRWVIRPRVLTDVSTRSLGTRILQKPVAFPVGVAPTAMQKLWHPGGECVTAKGAEMVGTVFILSTLSTCSIEEVAKAAPLVRKWFQFYFQRDRSVSQNLLRRAENSGFEAVVFTLDTRVWGKRRKFAKEPLKLPKGMALANFANGTHSSSPLSGDEFDLSLTWKDLDWIRQQTSMRLVLKGIITAEDAKLAVAYGIDGIVVSNHGGRQLDSVLPTLAALPEIVKAVQGRCEIYIDGGFTLGTDVYKALALGADMVFVGKAALWGLAVGGAKGVAKVLELFKTELDTAMALSGVSTIRQIGRNYVQAYNPL